MKKMKVLALLLAAALLLTGCSAKEEKAAASLYVNVIDTYMAQETVDALAAELTQALPALNTKAEKLSVLGISAGDSEKDPMGTMAGMAQIAGLMATGEMELMICNADQARRHGDSGEAFIPLDELFTQEEQTALGIVPVSVPVLDDEGNPTGEMSALCGVDLSGCTGLMNMLCTSDMAAYVMVNAKHVDNAKLVIRHLLNMK